MLKYVCIQKPSIEKLYRTKVALINKSVSGYWLDVQKQTRSTTKNSSIISNVWFGFMDKLIKKLLREILFLNYPQTEKCFFF